MTAAHLADPTAFEAQWHVRHAWMIEPVTAFLAKNPNASIRQIARGTGTARLQVERVLNALCASGRIQWECEEAR